MGVAAALADDRSALHFHSRGPATRQAPPAGLGLPLARLLFFGPATLLTAGLFFIYAWRVYFEPQYGGRARRALAGVLLLHLGLNLALLGPFLRK